MQNINMIKKIKIQNFRSLKNIELQLGKINVFYGTTGGGKSSVFYPLLILKNFYLNPNQPLNSLFNLKYINLGDFKSLALLIIT